MLTGRVASIIATLSIVLLIAACASAGEEDEAGSEAGGDGGPAPAAATDAPAEAAYQLKQLVSTSLELESTSLKETGFLQAEFTCEGADSSPHISWADVPPDTKSIAVIAEDLDYVGIIAAHWLLFGIPPDTREIPAGASGSSALPAGAVEGVNNSGRTGYNGPCPPPKVLNNVGCGNTGFDSDPYVWSVYALSKVVPLGPSATRDDLLREIDGSILGAGSIDVKYISKKLLRTGTRHCVPS